MKTVQVHVIIWTTLMMCIYKQSFESVDRHLELVILSKKFKITEHIQSSVVEYSKNPQIRTRTSKSLQLKIWGFQEIKLVS